MFLNLSCRRASQGFYVRIPVQQAVPLMRWHHPSRKISRYPESVIHFNSFIQAITCDSLIPLEGQDRVGSHLDPQRRCAGMDIRQRLQGGGLVWRSLSANDGQATRLYSHYYPLGPCLREIVHQHSCSFLVWLPLPVVTCCIRARGQLAFCAASFMGCLRHYLSPVLGGAMFGFSNTSPTPIHLLGLRVR